MPVTRLPAAAALIAAFSMAASPAAAAELPASGTVAVSVATPGAWDSDSVNADRHRYNRYRRNRTSVGDVLAGVLIIGGIAAVASAAKRNSDYRYRDARYPDRPYEYRMRGDSRYGDASGFDRAADMCLREIERDTRVDRVDQVDRTARGWLVTGSLYNGEGFACRIGNDGRIESVDFGAGFAGSEFLNDNPARYDGRAGPAEDRQWDDARYQQAWRDRDAASTAQQQPEIALPAYPGGPLPGEEGYDEAAAEDEDFEG